MMASEAWAPIVKASGHHHCPTCDKGFRQRSNCVAHHRSVHLDLRDTCPHCNKTFKKLKHHIRDVHVAKALVTCGLCSKQYPEGRLFKDHMNKVHLQSVGHRPLDKFSSTTVCKVCGDPLLRTRLPRHMRLRHFLPPHYVVQCPLCGGHVKWMAWHLAKQHKERGGARGLHRCKRCDQFFLTTQALAEHMQNHEEYRCAECGEELACHLDLARHMYGAHGRVYNLGKKFKSGRRLWEVGTTATAPTYRVTALEEGEVGEMEEEEVDEVDDYIEETFTVVLDEKGNLQQIVVAETEEGQEDFVNDLCKSKIETVCTTDKLITKDMEIILPNATADEDEDKLEVGEMEDNGEEGQEECEEEEDETQEYEVEIEGGGQSFQLVLPSSLGLGLAPPLLPSTSTVSTTTSLPASSTLPTSASSTLPASATKLFERLVSGGEELPRSLEGVALSQEDEGVLAAAPAPRAIQGKDLARFQIGRRVQGGSKPPKKSDSCPSRQAHLCPYCRQVLKTRNALSRHIAVVHLEQRNFECSHQCGKTYATQADMMKHVRAAHSEQGNTMVECEICGDQFKESYLKRHQYYKHKGNHLPRNCSYCGKEFKTREIMMKHIRNIHKKK